MVAATSSLSLGRFRHAVLLSVLAFGSSLTVAFADGSSVDDVGGDAYRHLQELPALQKTFSGRGAPPTPLPECEGDCDKDSHCAGDLQCFQRYVSYAFFCSIVFGISNIRIGLTVCILALCLYSYLHLDRFGYEVSRLSTFYFPFVMLHRH